jgi:uncharacterized protein involved in exopolysaccharide biosynthesis/Mrp family chromosome partitioning ATPase
LGLAERPEFDPLSKGMGIGTRIAIALGFRSDPRRQSAEERAYGRYSGGLNVYQIPQSKVIVIKYSSTDPKAAADVANALAETYVVSTRESESEPTGRAREWLASQIESLRQKVVETEAAAEEYRARAGLLKGTQSTLSAQELQELSSQIVLAEAQRVDARAKANSIRDQLAQGGRVDASTEALNSPLIQRLREQQATLSRSRAQLAITYLPSHPKLAAVQSEIANIDRQIRNEAMRIVGSLEDQAKIASSREATLRASLNAAKMKASGTNQDEVKLRALEREAAANRQLLETFLNRYTDASSRQDLNSQPGMARIIQRAAVPSSPSYPLAGPTVLLAALAGLTLGLGLAFLAEVMSASTAPMAPVFTTIVPPVELASDPPRPEAGPPSALQARILAGAGRLRPKPLDETLRGSLARSARLEEGPSSDERMTAAAAALELAGDPETPKNATDAREASESAAPIPAAEMAPALCELPATPDTSAAIANAYQPVANPAGGFASAMRLVSSWAIGTRQTSGVQRIGVACAGQAATDAAASVAGLARTLAGQGLRTLIIDADPASAVLQIVLGVGQGPGLAELLVGQAQFETVIAKDTASPVQLLRVGQNRAAIPALLASAHMDAVLDALGQVYDMTIVHGGDTDGAGQLAIKKCHAAIVLASAANLNDAARSIEALRKAGLRAVQFLRINRPVQKAA